MYVKEAEWFKKQERKKACIRKLFPVSMLVTLLLFVCVGVQSVFAMEILGNRLDKCAVQTGSVAENKGVLEGNREAETGLVQETVTVKSGGSEEYQEEFKNLNVQDLGQVQSESERVEESELSEGNSSVMEEVQEEVSPKIMYLTFDDGPRKGSTEKILDVLKEKGIKATFFVIGENVERNPEITKRIVEEGHAIGIHCYQHDYNILYDSVDAYVKDFEKAQKVIYETTGVRVGIYRFPGGSINDFNREIYKDIIKEMNKQGYVYFDWNASMEDAVKKPSPEKIIKNATESTLGRKKIVMLGHDTVQITAECLDELLEEFTDYEMRVLDETIVPIQF